MFPPIAGALSAIWRPVIRVVQSDDAHAANQSRFVQRVVSLSND